MSFANTIKRILPIAALGALICCAALAGCAQPAASSSAEEEAGPTSRSYMADMNQAVDDLKEKMASFTDAVAREDAVSMRVQADSAFAVVDQISEIEAPEELGELKQKYVDACYQLKDALNGYLALYTEIDTATTRNPFAYDTYADRIAALQEQYDAAVQALEDADKSATEM